MCEADRGQFAVALAKQKDPSTKKPHYDGFDTYRPGELCPEPQCPVQHSTVHYHCAMPRYYHATNKKTLLKVPLK